MTDSKGHQASSPRQMPRAAWKRGLFRFYLLAISMTLSALAIALAALAGTAALAYLQPLLPNASRAAVTAGKLIGYVLLTAVAAAIASTPSKTGPRSSTKAKD
jgi:hypothetical protein